MTDFSIKGIIFFLIFSKGQLSYFETEASISKQWQNFEISKCRFQDFKSGET